MSLSSQRRAGDMLSRLLAIGQRGVVRQRQRRQCVFGRGSSGKQQIAGKRDAAGKQQRRCHFADPIGIGVVRRAGFLHCRVCSNLVKGVIEAAEIIVPAKIDERHRHRHIQPFDVMPAANR